MKKLLLLLLLCTLFYSCDKSPIKPGEMRYIGLTDNYVIGTDSTLVIINRETGETLNTIKRHQ